MIDSVSVLWQILIRLLSLFVSQLIRLFTFPPFSSIFPPKLSLFFFPVKYCPNSFWSSVFEWSIQFHPDRPNKISAFSLMNFECRNEKKILNTCQKFFPGFPPFEFFATIFFSFGFVIFRQVSILIFCHVQFCKKRRFLYFLMRKK